MPDSCAFGHRLLFPSVHFSLPYPSSSCLNFLKNKAGLPTLCYKVFCQWLQACVHSAQATQWPDSWPLLLSSYHRRCLCLPLITAQLFSSLLGHRHEWIELARTQ